MNKIPGNKHTYYSVDVAKSRGIDQSEEDLQLNYQPEYLNSFIFPGFPLHKLELKEGAVIMLLRNLSVKTELCNGTRLQIVKLHKNIIAARIMSGVNTDDIVFIPRVKLDTGESTSLPFILHRTQFPILHLRLQ